MARIPDVSSGYKKVYKNKYPGEKPMRLCIQWQKYTSIFELNQEEYFDQIINFLMLKSLPRHMRYFFFDQILV